MFTWTEKCLHKTNQRICAPCSDENMHTEKGNHFRQLQHWKYMARPGQKLRNEYTKGHETLSIVKRDSNKVGIMSISF